MLRFKKETSSSPLSLTQKLKKKFFKQAVKIKHRAKMGGLTIYRTLPPTRTPFKIAIDG
jgi:hypothetical protein